MQIFSIISLSRSDHDMVICVHKMNHLKYKAKFITSRNYSCYNPIDLQREMQNTDFTAVIESTNVDDAVAKFTNILSNVFDKHAPIVKKRTKGKPSPWLDADIKRDMVTVITFYAKQEKLILRVCGNYIGSSKTLALIAFDQLEKIITEIY